MGRISGNKFGVIVADCGNEDLIHRVTNLKNGKSIIVRVNDRGPFVHNRLIDLSYSAALRLDMVTDGTSLVEVEAISLFFGSATPSTSTQSNKPTDNPT